MRSLFARGLVCGALALIGQGADRSTFVFRTESLTPYTRSYLGNGYFSLVTHQLGSKPAESYMVKVYDRAPDDVPRIAALPAWNEVNVFNGERWLNDTALDNGSLRGYSQALNMYDAYLLTRYDWVDGGRSISVEIKAFVSRSNRYLAAVQLRFTPHYAGVIKVLLPVRAWKAPTRLPVGRMETLLRVPQGKALNVRYPGHMVVQDRKVEVGKNSGQVQVVARADGGNTSIAEAVAITWPQALKKLTARGILDQETAGVELEFETAAGESCTFTKYIGAASSIDEVSPAGTARETAEAARARGFDSVFAEHAAAWHEIWKTDVLVEGNPELQRVIHSTLFYLLESVREGTGFNIPPMGLSSSGYVGHIFWDSDTFMYPVLLLLHPDMAKSLAMFRCNTLEAARTNAQLRGYKGAMYPWEADETGAETTPRFAWDNALKENHVTADVALAQWQYYLATGDQDYLASCAYPVLKETADYWVSRGTYNQAKDRYEIRDIVSPDEGSRGVNNDVVTNVGARKNLELAIHASRILGKTENPLWRKLLEGIYIPYSAEGEYFPEFEGASAWKGHIGHVTPLISYPFEYPMSDAAKRNTLENALKSITSTGGGAFLLPTIYPIVAAELRNQSLVDDCLLRSYQPYMKPPFNVINEGPRGESVNFLTGAGLLQQFLYGYPGLRLSEQGVTERFEPLLPSSVRKLTLQNLTIRGRKYDLTVRGKTLTRRLAGSPR
jgi:trehalose/maltose hydrolase-like predicted phosphorylase